MSRSGPSISERSRPSPAQPGGSRLRRVAALLVVAAVVGLFFALRLDHLLSFERLIESRDILQTVVARHPATTLGAFAVAITVCAAFAIPGVLILTLAGGFLFGGGIAGGLSAAMVTTGGICLFLAARGMLHDFLASRAGNLGERMRRQFRQNALSYMLFLRLTPLVPFWLVTIVAALAGVTVRTFVWTTALGVLPMSFVIAFAGEHLDRLVAAGREAYDTCRAGGRLDCRITLPLNEILSSSTLMLLAGAALLALTPLLAQTWLRPGRQPPPDAP